MRDRHIPVFSSAFLAAALAGLLLAVPGPARGMDARVLYQKVKGSVVIVYKKALGESQYYFGGSGFVVGDGTVAVTNHHVVEGVARTMQVVTLDGRAVENVRVLRFSVADDLALLGLPERLPPLELYPGKIRIGQPVAVLGNPMGYMGTQSTGIVSGFQTNKRWGDVFQTSAPNSPGSSGSPMLDGDGRVVGVICGGSAAEQNMNFAVPVEKLRRLLGRDLSPTADGGTGRDALEPDRSLEIRTAPDGAITIIQKRKSGQ